MVEAFSTADIVVAKKKIVRLSSAPPDFRSTFDTGIETAKRRALREGRSITDALYAAHEEDATKLIELTGSHLGDIQNSPRLASRIRGQFAFGVGETIRDLRERTEDPSDIDPQQVALGTIPLFTRAVRIAEKYGASPVQRLMLASHAPTISPKDLSQLVATHSDIPVDAIIESVLHYPHDEELRHDFLVRYKDYRKRAQSLQEDARERDPQSVHPFDVYAQAAIELKDPEEVIAKRAAYTDFGELRELEYGDWKRVPYVPEPQKGLRWNWCSISTMSMDLSAAMGRPFTQQDIYRDHVGFFDPVLVFMESKRGPSFHDLRDMVADKTSYKATILKGTDYEILGRKRPELADPFAAMRYFLDSGLPVHTRTPNHTILVVGYRELHGKHDYHAINPSRGNQQVWPESILDTKWSHEENSDIHGSTNYLMMVVRK